MSEFKIKIFLSSSADNLEEERKRFPTIISNVQKAFIGTCSLVSYIWEEDASTFSNGKSFQDVINEDIKEANIVVFLFCTRMGEHTKEEWQIIEKSENVVRIVFRKEWYPKFSSLDQIAIDKYLSLKDFCEDYMKTHFLNSVENVDQFESRLTHQLLIEIPKILETHGVEMAQKRAVERLAEKLMEQTLKRQNINEVIPIRVK